jgi:hypothetical protein
MKRGDRRARQNKFSGKGVGKDILLTHSSAKSALSAIRGPVRPSVELHYNDTASAAYAADTTGTITLLNGIAEGNDNVNRLGRKAVMHDLAFSGYAIPTTTTGTSQQQRLLFVWDNAPNGVLPAITDILVAANSTSFPNVNNVARFTILFDQTWVVGLQTAAIADQVIKNIPMTTIKLRSPTQYLGTTAAIGSVQNGGLYQVTLGSNAAGVTAGLIATAVRVTFTDVL